MRRKQSQVRVRSRSWTRPRKQFSPKFPKKERGLADALVLWVRLLRGFLELHDVL